MTTRDGAPRRSNAGRKPVFDQAEAVRLVRGGMSIAAAAALLGVCEASVGHAVRKAEAATGERLPRTGYEARRLAVPEQVARLLAQGLCQAEVARHLGVNRSSVNRAVKSLELA